MWDSILKLNSSSLPTAPTPSFPSHHNMLPPSSPPGRSLLTSAKRSAPSSPPAPSPARKRAAVTDVPKPSGFPSELGEYTARDARLLHSLGWHGLVAHRRPLSDLSMLDNVPHPARRLLRHYKHRGAPVKFSTPPWTRQQIQRALSRGPHNSAHEYLDYLEEEFIDMINKGQWIVLPYSAVSHLPGLRISPPGVIPQRDRRPRWIVDYSWWDVNNDTLPLAAMESMQFGHALDRILREILLANPAFGPVHLIKLDISDGFYRIALAVDDIPKLGVAFPTANGADPLVAFPLVLPMGWKNSPPIFSTATETIADLANARLRAFTPPLPHHLDDMAELIASQPPALPIPAGITLSVPRDPSLPNPTAPLAYADVYVDDFVGAAQRSLPGTPGLDNRRRVRRLLLHAVDDVFRPLSGSDGPDRREPVSMKKLAAGDCSWGTIKQVLGWIIDSVNMTIALPPYRASRLLDLLDSFPPSQKRTSTKRWYAALGELRSMALALPGARNIFSSMQNALSTQSKNRIALGKGVHDALNDFRWMHANISTRPTRIAELIPLPPVAVGHHDASGKGAGGIWFPGPQLTPRVGYTASSPLVWRHEWPQHITSLLVTDSNPSGSITNSDLELAGGLLHLDALAQSFDIRERTVLSQGDNLSTTFWERKGSTSTSSAPAYLLRLFGIHQRIHRYIPRFDYISGASNHVADSLSRDFHFPWSDLLPSLSDFLPQSLGCQVSTPSPQIVSAVTSALLRRPSSRESLLDAPLAMPLPGQNGSISQVSWASTPFSKPSKTKFLSYKSSPDEYILANLRPAGIPSSLNRLKITYGTLPRRSSIWGPRTHASTQHPKSTSASNASSERGKRPTPPRFASNPSPLQ